MKLYIKIGLLLLLAFLMLSQCSGGHAPAILLLKHNNPKSTAYMGNTNRNLSKSWRKLSSISSHLRHAVIVAEDGAFYKHHGIDFHEFKESVKKNIKEKKFSRGFSTITMQLARNLYLSPKKSLFRKGQEIIIALILETYLSKDRIFELYLNVIEWGRGIYGIQAASRHYFHTSAGNLSIEQAAFLAAIIPSPQRWGRWPPGPYVSGRMERLMSRIYGRWPSKKKSNDEGESKEVKKVAPKPSV